MGHTKVIFTSEENIITVLRFIPFQNLHPKQISIIWLLRRYKGINSKNADTSITIFLQPGFDTVKHQFIKHLTNCHIKIIGAQVIKMTYEYAGFFCCVTENPTWTHHLRKM